MSNASSDFSQNVFVNCPFDPDYVPLLRPLLFTVLYLRYLPRIASERLDSGEPRIDKIVGLIKQSRFSIHDISRMESSEKEELYRPNMAFYDTTLHGVYKTTELSSAKSGMISFP